MIATRRLRLPLVLPALAAALALSGCGGEEKPGADPDASDPALTEALGDQIMVDPDLAQQNGGNAAVAANGPASTELPPAERSPEAIAKARAEAAKMAGGAIQSAPAPVATEPAAPGAVTPIQLAALSKSGASNCADKAEYSASWAARLPDAMAIYPRGHVVEAAGTDADGCRLRVVNYVTPVAPKDVIDFYYTRLSTAGFDARQTIEGKDAVLAGKKDAAAFVIYTRKLDSGLTEVDLVANGG